MSEAKYYVGQELWRHDVNQDRRGGPTRVTITKIGRKLVTIQGSYGRPETYGIADGVRNDAYRHSSLCTDEEHAAHLARSATLRRLRDLHLRFESPDYSNHDSTNALNAVADLLESDAPHGTTEGEETA